MQEPWVAPFREIDGRAGWYAAASWTIPERLEVRALLYDNRGDLLSVERGQYAWKTRFAAAEALVRPARGVELLGGLLDGWSAMGEGEAVDAYWRTWFVLGSLRLGAHRLSLRFERFDVRDEDRYASEDPNGEDGDAFTAAWGFAVDRRTSLFLELLSVASTREARALLGLPERARETLVQLGVRGRF